MSIMKSPIEHKGKISTTSGVHQNKISLPLKKHNNYLLSQINKLGADHDVTVSGTMIKVTYKKTVKDHFASPKCFNGFNTNTGSGSVLSDKNMSTSKGRSDYPLNRSADTSLSKSSACDSSDSIVVVKSKNSSYVNKGNNHSVFHSTPKLEVESSGKKKKDYVNGLNLLMKLDQDGLKDNSPITFYNRKPKIATAATSSQGAAPTSAQSCSKATHIKLGPGNKLPGGTIKIPEGITIIRLKGDSSLKSDKRDKPNNNVSIIPKLKKAPVEVSPQAPKESKNVPVGVKRKLNISVTDHVTSKIMKINDLNSQFLKKKLKKSNEVASKQVVNPSESLSGEDVSEQSTGNNASGTNKKEVLLNDPDLPPGWKRVVVKKHEGTPQEKYIVYIYSPQGKKFQFKWKLRKYLQRTKSKLTAEQFHFGLYKRTKPTYVPPSAEVDEEEEEDEDDDDDEQNPEDESLDKTGDGQKRQLLLYDPDLPFGWKRIINTNNSTGKLQVQIISPEGRIFRRRYGLNEYLIKNQYSYGMDRFYFGLYPKRDSSRNGYNDEDGGRSGNASNMSVTNGKHDTRGEGDDDDGSSGSGNEEFCTEAEILKLDPSNRPMYVDPNLPEGWKRFIKIRSYGRSAGKMEVIIVSPDGRRHRSRGQLEVYLQKRELRYNAEDFDFSVFGRTKRISHPVESKDVSIIKKRTKPQIASERPVADLDINALKTVPLTREGEMINEVNGLMIACDLSTSRTERRLRLPRNQHEKLLKSYLDSESNVNSDDCDISPSWVEKLVKCRSDFRPLEPDAASLIAARAKEFIRDLTAAAFESSENPEMGLRYDDVANVVDGNESLSPLKLMIPKRISYKDYVKFNRPKQFLSFT